MPLSVFNYKNPYIKVCSRHFSKDDYKPREPNRLKSTAVPHLNIPDVHSAKEDSSDPSTTCSICNKELSKDEYLSHFNVSYFQSVLSFYIKIDLFYRITIQMCNWAAQNAP